MVSYPAWMGAAACAGADPELWFPPAWNSAEAQLAVQVCAGCPVASQCLEFALTQNCWHGIFGGLQPRERRELARSRGWPVDNKGRLVSGHGTPAMARRHYRDGTPLCDACYAAENARRGYASLRGRHFAVRSSPRSAE